MSYNKPGYNTKPPLIPGSTNWETNYSRFLQVQSITDGKATLSGGTLSNLNDPVNLKDAANKEFVLANATTDPSSSRTWKNPVIVATTGSNITLSGTQTIDDVSLSIDDRVLVKDQTDAQENGIYIVSSSTWSRSTDCAEGVQATGVFVYTMSGTLNAEKIFYCLTINNASPFFYPVNFGYSSGIVFSELVADNSASGPNYSVQYNLGGSLAGSSGLTFDGIDKINIQQIQSTSDFSTAKLYTDHNSSLIIGSSVSTLYETAIYGYGANGINLFGTDSLIVNDDGGSINLTSGKGSGVGNGGSINLTARPKGFVKVLGTADSTSYATGALLISGGVGVASSVTINSTVSANTVKAGNTLMTSGQIVGLNTPSNTDLDHAANVNYVNSQIGSSASGSNTEVQYNNAGAFGASANFTYNGSSLSILNNTSSTSTATGALKVTGGVGIGGVLNATGITSSIMFASTGRVTNLNSTSITSANMIINGTASANVVQIGGTAMFLTAGRIGGILTPINTDIYAAANVDYVNSQVGSGAAGSDTEIQYNNLGAFGASPNLKFNGTNLTVLGGITTTNLFATNGSISNLVLTSISTGTLNVSGSSVFQGISSTILNVTTITAGVLNVSGSSVVQGISSTILNVGTITAGILNVSGTSNLQAINTTTISSSTLNVSGSSVVQGVSSTILNVGTITAGVLNVSGTSNLQAINTTTISSSTLNVSGSSVVQGVSSTILNVGTITAGILNVSGTSNLQAINTTTISGSSLSISGSSIVQEISSTILNVTTITTGTLNVSGSSIVQGISSTILNVTTITTGTLNVSGSSIIQNVSASQLNATTVNSINYVGLTWKNSVLLVSTSTNDIITPSGSVVVDGISTSTGDRVLLIAQGTASQNGIYIANDSGAWSRSIDMAAGSRAAGAVVSVTNGNSQSGSTWKCISTYPNDLVDSSNLTFSAFTSGGGGGGGGAPGGNDGNIQYRVNSSTFGGSNDLILDGNITFATNLTTNNLMATAGTITNLVISGTSASTDTSTGALVVGGGVGISGEVYAYDYNTVSDARYKSDIILLDGSLNKISKINGYSYIFDPTGKRNYGFLAQQLEEAGLNIPVNGSGSDMMSVNYQSIIPLLVEAIKELKEKFDNLESKII